VGRLQTADTFDPKYAIILSNKDEIRIPLDLEQVGRGRGREGGERREETGRRGRRREVEREERERGDREERTEGEREEG
jgi:hypothetical protein